MPHRLLTYLGHVVQEEKTKFLPKVLVSSIEQQHGHILPSLASLGSQVSFLPHSREPVWMEVTYKMNCLQHLHQKVTLAQARGHRWGSRLALLILASLSWPRDHLGELPGLTLY